MKVSGWAKWQTFRTDRGTPPWIKVHRNLFSNPEWVSLSDAERGQLVHEQAAQVLLPLRRREGRGGRVRGRVHLGVPAEPLGDGGEGGVGWAAEGAPWEGTPGEGTSGVTAIAPKSDQKEPAWLASAWPASA